MTIATQQPECRGKGTIRVDVRWMLRRDMPEVLTIEQLNFSWPWSESDFTRCLRQRNCIGMVAENGGKIRGYMVYELMRDRIQLLNFAVLPSVQRFGVGAQMMRKLVSKLSPERRNRVTLEVSEVSLDAQLFFKAQGFRAVAVLRGHYEQNDDDAYVMEYTHPAPSDRSEG